MSLALLLCSAFTPQAAAETAEGGANVSTPSSASMSIYLSKAGSGAVLPPSVDDAEAFCALALGCKDVPLVPPAQDFPGCVRALLDQLSSPAALNASVAIRECGLNATSCSRLRQCALKGAAPNICEGVALESKEPIGKCDLEARAVTCWRGKVLGVRNCGLADELCVVKEGRAECALPGPCPPGAKAEWTCAGTRMVKCQESRFLSVDCRVLNLACTDSVDTTGRHQVGCAPSMAPTCKDSKIACKEANAVGCVLGKTVSVECGDQGMTCADPSKAPGYRTAGACEMPQGQPACDPSTFPAKCDGSSIRYCSFGTVRSYPCKSTGATRCATDKGIGPRCVQ